MGYARSQMKNAKKKNSIAMLCPCGSGAELSSCCGKFHSGMPAPDAISLMKSRYSAYALGLENYLLMTWHKSTRPKKLDLNSKSRVKWVNLKIVTSSQQSDTTATVEFIASYKINGRAEKMHEISYFICDEGQLVLCKR